MEGFGGLGPRATDCLSTESKSINGWGVLSRANGLENDFGDVASGLAEMTFGMRPTWGDPAWNQRDLPPSLISATR